MIFDVSSPPKGTIRDWLDARADEGGLGFVFPEDDDSLEWGELRNTAREIAAMLTSRAIAPGESIAVMMANGRAAIECLFGILYGGFRATMINLVAGDDAIAYALNHSDARFAFVGDAQMDIYARTTKPWLIEALDTARTHSVSNITLHDIAPSSHALLMYTSGTTGRPKGVVHTHTSLLAGGWTTAVAHELTPQDRGFCVLPIYHINGLCVTVMGTLVSGGALAMVPKFSASRFWQQMGISEATWFSVVPTIISHLLHAEADPDPTQKKTLRFGRSASSALAPEIQRAFEDRFDVPIIETMGLTETAAQILSNPLPPGTRKIGSPGVGYGNEVAIFDTTFNEVPRGQEGELVIRGPNVMLKYLKNDKATTDSFTSDGWLRTGDLGRMDADGYVFITGRLKELIIKGGENIAPREIDEALYSHPDVIEAAAFGQPCDSYGERVQAAVKVRGGSAVTASDLLEICKTRLGAFKSPDQVFFMDDLPKGPSGKIQRIKIQKEIEKLGQE